jgi:hypothetical protein
METGGGANRFCAQCGQPLPPGAAYCSGCGQAVLPAEEPISRTPAAGEPARAAPAPVRPALAKLARQPGWVAIGAVALVLLGSLAGAQLVGGSPQEGPVVAASSPRAPAGTPVAPSQAGGEVAGTPAAPHGPGEAATYTGTIDGRIVLLPWDEPFAAREMPPEDSGQVVERFELDADLVVQELTTPFWGTETRQPEVALWAGDWVTRPEAGVIQVVTNFGMWAHIPNGDKTVAQFPTHIGELVRGEDDADSVYYMDSKLLGGTMTLESVPNLFVSHSSGTHALRIIRIGRIDVRLDEGGDELTSEVDLIGWAATGTTVFPTPEELGFYRYQATFTGRRAP